MKYYENAIFFPAMSIATHTTIMKNNWLVNNKSPRFYLNSLPEDQKVFSHPYFLTSAAHNYKNMNFMKELGINDVHKDVDLIFGDSGGFQIATGDLTDTEDIKIALYNWMVKNSSIAPIIDVPPWTLDDTNVTTAKLMDAIRRTKENIKILEKIDNKKTVDWLNVLHGFEYNHRCVWYDNMKDEQDITTGWALGCVKKNYFVILLALAALLDNKIIDDKKRCKLVHFFGLTSTKYMPLVIYIKHKLNMCGYKINVSFDSSYATQNGGWGKYLLYPSSTGFMSYHLSNRLVGKFNDVPMPCKCPVCNGYTLQQVLNEKALTNEGESLFYNVVQSHNVYMLVEYVNMLHSLIYTNNYDLYSTCFKSEQIKIFKIIDKMFDMDRGKVHLVVEQNEKILNAYRDESDVGEIESFFD